MNIQFQNMFNSGHEVITSNNTVDQPNSISKII